METVEEHHNRRINEINERIKYLQSYIDNKTALKHNQRVDEFKSEIEGLKRVVEMHINKIR